MRTDTDQRTGLRYFTPTTFMAEMKSRVVGLYAVPLGWIVDAMQYSMDPELRLGVDLEHGVSTGISSWTLQEPALGVVSRSILQAVYDVR